MDDETRAAFAETHRAFARIDQAFGRVDRYFGLVWRYILHHTSTQGGLVYRVTEGATIATVTDLRRRTTEVMEQAEDGAVVVVQKDNEPQGVYLSYRRYKAILDRLNKLENLELAQIAVARKEAVDGGEMGTTSLEDMIAEFAPELLTRERSGGA